MGSGRVDGLELSCLLSVSVGDSIISVADIAHIYIDLLLRRVSIPNPISESTLVFSHRRELPEIEYLRYNTYETVSIRSGLLLAVATIKVGRHDFPASAAST